MKKWIVLICQYFVGILFIFSGLIKLNDPVGTAIKLEEYFDVFAEDHTLGLSVMSGLWHFFASYALTLSVLVCVLEVVLGIALLALYKPKATVWSLFGLIAFFSFLTFYSAFFNKVTDCGCFGDAIKLTPWGSFTKDIVLLVLILVLLWGKEHLQASWSEKIAMSITVAGTAAAFFVSIWAIRHLPFIDFRPYKVGANIPESMTLPPGVEGDKYEYVFKLKNSKSGEEKEMSDKLYTDSGIWKDTTWKYVDRVEKLVKAGAKPKITDYSVWNDEGDFTKQTFEGNKFCIIITNVAKTNPSVYPQINALVKQLESVSSVKIEPIVLTASDHATFEAFRHEVQLAVPYYYADGKVLKTIMRSDPGFWLLQNGVVKGKWHYNDVPTAEKVAEALH
ncbi:hypothetical protein SAMN05421780_106159 [Flexibacter flexilis DSM 6793]|uniref:Methylamine utilisation protein MauE domain-containing protein n=1 Tax=Flexibacter flexilis DSM 6793 TaxID=927664 RepID=A0A1I1K5J6_9BACT|nr:BT_3928 family protein [Flexibacter flexilis]SFC53283.1 hypothetical protein SAMN05421780_106159 [Flexibacter flexilis DSM 6793]